MEKDNLEIVSEESSLIRREQKIVISQKEWTFESMWWYVTSKLRVFQTQEHQEVGEGTL